MLNKTEKDQLVWKLTMLHELLEDVEQVSPETKEAMQTVATDLSRILERETLEEDWSHLRQRWREAVLDFESQHPRLAQAVDQITSALANAGI